MKRISMIFFKVVLIGFVFLVLLLIAYRINKAYYDNKFESVAVGITKQDLQNEWGKPNKIHSYNHLNEEVFEYQRDWIGFYQYLFMFDRQTQILVRKTQED